MAIREAPIESQWYRYLDTDEEFYVVSVDEDESVVEVQYADGEGEELDLNGWYALEIEPIQPPEDWVEDEEGDEDEDEDEDEDYDEDEDEDDEDDDWGESVDDDDDEEGED